MANELSRVSDRLIRARERTGNGAATVWLPPPARREPTRRELPPEPPERASEPAAQSRRPPATWVAIHVQLRHEHERAPSIFDAPPADLDDDEVYVDAPPVDSESDGVAEAPRALPAHTLSDAFSVRRTLASEGGPKQTRAPGILQYLATRALSAYLTQSSFASSASAEPRVLDVLA